MLQQWLRDRCVPVVATLVTEDADLACRKNNVNFEQLVSAFARMDGIKVPFRSSSQQYSLESFACRFVRGSSMRPSSARERDAPLADIAIRATEEESARAAAAAAGGVGAGAKGALLDSAIDDQEWYKRFRSRIWEDLCHQEHEMLDCPAAVLVVVSSTESSGDPVACFHELSSPRYLPPPFESKQYDPVSPALVYVLLHDWCQGAAQGVDPFRVLSQMQGTFTAGQCRLLCINSLPPDCPNLAQPDIWADKIHQDDDYEFTSVSMSPSAGEVGSLEKKRVRGCCLSPEDLTVAKEFVHGLATQVVVPSMERRILDLNAKITSVRKGVKNFVKSWLRKPRDTIDPYGGDAGGAGGSATYRFDRIESQIRLLADSAFLMRDYDTAISMYRMARDDFKSDRALLHYASASEMLAISLYLQQQGRVAPFVLSPGGSFASPHITGGFSGAIGGVATAAATAAVTAAGAAVATGAVGVRDLSWQSAAGVGGGVAGSSFRTGEFSVAPPPASSGGSSSVSVSISGHGQGAPNSSSGGFSGGIGINPSALLGRGREADAAFSAALEAYHRRAAEDSRGYLAATTGARSGGGYYGGSGVPPFPSPSARLGARASLLFADVVSSTVDAYSTPKGLLTGGEELQTLAEEALLNASVHENSLCAAVLLEVSANRCRASGRLRRASFRLIQAGHMYKTFAKERVEALRRGDKEATEGSFVARAHEDKSRGRYREQERERYFGMHAARCFLAALSGYQGSGWRAAEDYTCNALPTELCALQRPVAALQLYLRMLASREQGAAAAGRVATGGVRSSRTGVASSQSLQLHQHQQQQQQQHKRAVREASLLRALGDLCWRYPDAARVAARAWERSRESSRLEMSFFPLTERAKASPPPPPPSPTRRPLGSALSPASSKSRFPPTVDLNSASGGVVVSKGQDDKGGVVVVFEGLALPGVVHEDTRVVNTENAALEAAIEVSDSSQWATGMAEALRAETEATEAVRAGKGPWLTLAASCSHKAGSNSSANPRRPAHLPSPLRSAPVGEPVTVLVVLENHLSVVVPLKDMQLVLTSVAGKEAGGDEREEDIACVALDEEDFRNKYSSPPSSPMPVISFPHDEATVVVERRRATVGPGERIPVLLKFCALRPAASRLTVSAVRWTVFHWSEEGAGAAGGAPKGGGGGGKNGACPRVWVSHRLEGRGKLLHGTLEQRAARARAPAPPPQFEATGSMPWLGCCLEGVPATLLQGEAVKATLRITNRGRAPAGHLLLKTNLPWVAFEDDAAAGGGNVGPELSGEATGGAFGASGTTLRPPVDEIMPGEVVLLPLWVRGRGGGRQTVRMLLRYKRARVKSKSQGNELEEPPKPSDDALFSLERHAPLSMEMCVLPSLSVAASVLPSYSRRGEYVLSLEATNYRSNGDDALGTQHLRIHKVCAISRRWQMEPLAGFPNDSGGSGGGVEGGRSGVIVHWQERITLHYRLFPAKVEGRGDEHSAGAAQGGLVAPPVRHSDCALGVRARATGPGSADSPHLPLLCLEQASSNFYAACRKHRQQKLAAAAAAAEEHPRTIQVVRRERDRQRAIEALKKEEEEEKRRWRTQRHAHPTSPEALCAPDLSLVHLMVLWGLDGAFGKEPVRWGQHHVRSLVIRPERVERQCPLVLTVKYPSEVRWNSETHENGDDQEQGCDADVTVCATNRLAGPGDDARVNFTFEVRADDGPRRLATVSGAPPAAASGGGQGSSNKRPPRNRFVWLGPTRRRIVGLGPGEATTIPLKVRFLKPGVFDLNRFRFIVEFAPPGGKDGKGQPNPTNLPASAQQSLSLTPSQQSTQQQRKDSSASQQGRVTFVFPAQYLVTVAAADLPVGGEGERQKGPAPAMEKRVAMKAETETGTRALKVRVGGGAPRSLALEEVVVA